MGVDWHRMKLKPGTDAEELRGLARKQAVAYQSMNGWYPIRDGDPVTAELQFELHRTTCGAATQAIRERVDRVEWDRERKPPSDYSDGIPSWRVLVISQNPTFPPLVRCPAFRTILPDELPNQLDYWQRWAESVPRGECDAYLRELHWYATADWACFHWSCLHDAAVASLTATGSWAGKPIWFEFAKKCSGSRGPSSRTSPYQPMRTVPRATATNWKRLVPRCSQRPGHSRR